MRTRPSLAPHVLLQGFDHSQTVRPRVATARAASRAAQRRPWAVPVNPGQFAVYRDRTENAAHIARTSSRAEPAAHGCA